MSERVVTIGDFVEVDDFVEVSEHGLMGTVRRSLEAVGLRVVHELGEGSRAAADEPPQLVLVGSRSTGWAGRGTVTSKEGRAAGAPVVVVAMFDDEDSARAAMATGPRRQAPMAPKMLTAREMEVLEALANGASTGQVAQMLFISNKTVKNHLAHMYAKLGASSRTQAVAAAVRLGIVRIA
jgi:DNA-binding NarL/FixJ family response regulator